MNFPLVATIIIHIIITMSFLLRYYYMLLHVYIIVVAVVVIITKGLLCTINSIALFYLVIDLLVFFYRLQYLRLH